MLSWEIVFSLCHSVSLDLNPLEPLCEALKQTVGSLWVAADSEVQLVLPVAETSLKSVYVVRGFLCCIQPNLHEKSEMVKLFGSYSSSGVKDKWTCRLETLMQVRTRIFKSLFCKWESHSKQTWNLVCLLLPLRSKSIMVVPHCPRVRITFCQCHTNTFVVKFPQWNRETWNVHGLLEECQKIKHMPMCYGRELGGWESRLQEDKQ